MIKKHIKTIIALLMIITLCTAFIATVKATDDTALLTTEDANTSEEELQTTETTPAESEIQKHDLYLADNEINMDQIVDGNVFLMGSKVKITGKVNGNIYVMAKEVSFEKPSSDENDDDYCYIAGSAYIMAQTIKFDGVVQDIYALSQNFEMSYNSYILRDVKIAAESITLKGYITRDANLAAKNIDLGTAGETEADDDSVMIGGNLDYTSPNAITIPENRVIGEVKYNEDKTMEGNTQIKISVFDIVMNYVKDLVGAIIYTLIIYLIINFVAPKFFEKSGKILKENTLPSIGFGALAVCVLPIILIVLCFVFFKLSLTFIITYALLVFGLSTTITLGSLTELLKDKFGFANKKWLLLIIITIILWALKLIPILGGLLGIATTIVGSGLIIKAIFKYRKSLKESK